MGHVAAKVAGLKTPTKSVKHLPRKEGAELLTMSLLKFVTAYLKNANLLSSPATWRHGSLDLTKFLDLNLNARLLQRIVEC